METLYLVSDLIFVISCICTVCLIICVTRLTRIQSMILTKLNEQSFCLEHVRDHLRNLDNDVYDMKRAKLEKQIARQ